MEECELALNRTGIPESARISDGLRIRPFGHPSE
jgi:hypothetical protein